jgi:hypothetical protein
MASGDANRPEFLVPLTDLWSGFFAFLDAQNRMILQSLETPADSDPMWLRRRWLDVTSQAIEAYFRSPGFLRGVNANLKAMAGSRAFHDQWTAYWASQLGLPHAGEVRALADQLRRTEGTLRSHLEAIEDRLDDLETPRTNTGAAPDPNDA